MINRSHVWFASFVVILFAAGVASGVALDRTMGWGRRPFAGFRGGLGSPGGPAMGQPGEGNGMGPGRGRGGLGGPPTETFVNELDTALKLTAEQKTKIAAIIDESRPRLRALQEDSTKRFVAEQDAMRTEIGKVLTPEQAKKMDELRSKPRGGPFGFRNRGPRGM